MTKRKILVVDDNADAAEMLSTLLKLEGHHAVTANNATSALAALQDLRPDIIFLDIVMPECDGFALCRQIRQEEWASGILIVALTGWQLVSRDAADAGFDASFLKPASLEQLRSVLDGLPAAPPLAAG
jgi:CheY-like chemotaxis protein